MSLAKKIIAFDLDGTLTESKQALTSNMAHALTALAREKKVAVISGGSIEQYKKQFLPYFIEFAKDEIDCFHNLILMPTSGTEWYEYNPDEKIWTLAHRESFPEEIKNRVHEVLNKMITSGKYNIPKDSYGEIIEDRGSQITLSALGQAAPLEKKKFWDPDQKIRQVMKAEFETEIPDVSVSIGGTTSLDVLPKGFNKGVSLLRYIEKIDLKPGDLLYVGDALFPGGNDYSAIEAGFDALQVEGPEDTILNIKKWIS